MTTITLPRATVEQALEALESVQPQNMGPLIHPAKQALRAALAQQAEPRNQCRSDGRCQYAIDHGAEGIGHCPKSKCVMAQHTQPAEDRDVAQSNLRVMKEMFREQTEPAQQADLRQAAQQALEYMKSVGQADMYPEEWAIVGRLEAALAQQGGAEAVMQQALEILESDFTTVDGEFCRWCDSRLNAEHHCHLEQVIENLRAALAPDPEDDMPDCPDGESEEGA